MVPLQLSQLKADRADASGSSGTKAKAAGKGLICMAEAVSVRLRQQLLMEMGLLTNSSTYG